MRSARQLPLVPGLVAVLQGVEPFILAVQGHEFLVRTLLHDTSLLENHDAAGVLNGGESVGNDNGGRFFIKFSRASCTLRSLSVSRDEVASSSTRMGAFLSRARAMEIRWRSPPERRTPDSPITVSKPSGRFSIKSRAWAARAA